MNYYLLIIATLSLISEGFNSTLKARELTLSARFLTDLAQNLDSSSRSAEDYQVRGLDCLKLQQAHQASTHFNRAINLNLQSAEAYVGRGFICLDLGNLTKTQQDWEQLHLFVHHS